MKTINVKISNPGHSFKGLKAEYWTQLEKINAGTFEEKDGFFIINFSNGVILTIKKR